MSQTIKHPKTQEELDAILAEAGSKLVVIDFFATWLD
uniref:Thiol reductase thioredoxin n=1 Tax=Meloidogyne hapla TaxID=6305 RepID=A0A1I8B5J5_MELHA